MRARARAYELVCYTFVLCTPLQWQKECVLLALMAIILKSEGRPGRRRCFNAALFTFAHSVHDCVVVVSHCAKHCASAMLLAAAPQRRWRGCGGAGHLLLPLPPRPLPLPPRPLPLPLLPPQPRPGPGPRHEYLVKWMSSGTARRLRPSPAATSTSACPAPASVACAPRWVIRFQGLNFPIYLFSLETAPHEATPLHLAPTPHVHPTPWGGSPTPRRTLVSRF